MWMHHVCIVHGFLSACQDMCDSINGETLCTWTASLNSHSEPSLVFYSNSLGSTAGAHWSTLIAFSIAPPETWMRRQAHPSQALCSGFTRWAAVHLASSSLNRIWMNLGPRSPSLQSILECVIHGLSFLGIFGTGRQKMQAYSVQPHPPACCLVTYAHIICHRERK